MSRLASLSLAALLASAPAAAAGAESASAIAPLANESTWYGLSDVRHLGVQLDVGAPTAAGASLVFRPWWWVSFNGGLAYDYIGYGLRGGVSFVPVHWAVTPSLNLEYGHFLTGDATRFSSSSTPAEQALLKNTVYDFASAQIGLEFGSQRSFSFYLRGGLAYVSASANGNQLTALANEKSSDPSLQFALGNANIRALVPCASLGVVYYVY